MQLMADSNTGGELVSQISLLSTDLLNYSMCSLTLIDPGLEFITSTFAKIHQHPTKTKKDLY